MKHLRSDLAAAVLCSAMALLLLPVVAQTNVFEQPLDPSPGSPASQVLQPILDLLGGKSGTLVAIMAWVAAVSAALAPFSGMVSRGLRDMLNSAAASSDLEDDDFLRQLFAKRWYQTTSFVLRFVNVHLPTRAELERAVALQKEAVAEATKAANV